MSSVLKKTKQSSVNDLVTALDKFMDLLKGQKEMDAVEDLQVVSADLQKFQPDDQEFQAALKQLSTPSQYNQLLQFWVTVVFAWHTWLMHNPSSCLISVPPQ